MNVNYDDVKGTKRHWLHEFTYEWDLDDNGEFVFYCIDYRYTNVSTSVRRVEKIKEVDEYSIINVYDIMKDNFEEAKEVAEIMLDEWSVENKEKYING